jgi:hypothetical protein
MNFKKHTCIVLAFLLLVSNIGFAFNVHYCGNKIESVSLKSVFLENNAEKNCCGVVEKKSSCCKDKVFHFQKKSDGFDSKSFSFQSEMHFFVENQNSIFTSFCSNFKQNKITSYFCDANAPPFFKLYSQFIFYA